MKLKELIQELSFHGRTCTKDCSGHKAGWEWERAHQTNQQSQTPSPSFNDGTDIAISQRKAGRQPIGTNIRGANGRFQKFQKVKEDFDVDEMIGMKKFHDMTADQATVAIAQEMGTKVLGSGGAFGKVIQSHNPDIVYKVFERDDAYLAFIRFIQRVPSIHFPKIYKIKKMTSFFKRYEVQEDKFYVVALERLNEMTDEPFNALFVTNLLGLHSPHDPTRYLPNGYPNEGGIPAITFLNRYPQLKSLWTAALKIRGMMRDFSDFGWDVHRGNLMQRDDGTIVIIDPVTNDASFDYRDDIFKAKANRSPQYTGPHYNKKTVTPPPPKPGNSLRDIAIQARDKVAELEDKVHDGETLTPSENNMFNALKKMLVRYADQIGDLD